jgi:hypothetical protein
MRLDLAVPCDFAVHHLVHALAARRQILFVDAQRRGSGTGVSLSSIIRTSRGAPPGPVAMRAVITASCSGEVST